MTTFLSTCLLLVILCPGLDALEVSTGFASQEVPEVEGTQVVVMAADTATVTTLECVRNKSHNCLIEGGSCFSQRTKTYLNGSVETYRNKGCAEDCISANATFSSVERKYFQHIHYCCQKTLCNLRVLEMPPRNLNGLECPNLGVAESEASEGLNAIRCYDEETQCIEFVLVHDDSEVPDKVVKGCATPAFCELAKTSILNQYFSGMITRARCCGAIVSPKQLSF
ncbi:phospholipase A2 inhibitor and Ly6/PLAUR domain-containing protein-like [Podarcis raffonei]|uniref:phospholipase A2 inhibitor and Ly6/PLAUR domain-containing protein-like n=1 Tax=Podarcis raffonei TaxID=65483 RepID=UPI0023295196|nr:phospholipase A2 inhibitor and Ly6/PLAUR domain-containing protein-like [Podarcis raffonei]